MYQVSDFMENDEMKTLASAGPFSMLAYVRELPAEVWQ